MHSVLFEAEDHNQSGAIPDLLDALKSAIAEVLRSPLDAQVSLAKPSQLVAYLKFQMAALKREQVRVLFLDSRNRLIADEVMAVGTVNAVPLYPREIVARALANSATAIIIVHNHPSSDPAPSACDIAATRKMIAACRAVDIAVHDHLIISKGGWSSMRAGQFLEFSRIDPA